MLGSVGRGGAYRQSMITGKDALNTPEIRRRTQRVLVLQEKERDAEENQKRF